MSDSERLPEPPSSLAKLYAVEITKRVTRRFVGVFTRLEKAKEQGGWVNWHVDGTRNKEGVREWAGDIMPVGKILIQEIEPDQVVATEWRKE